MQQAWNQTPGRDRTWMHRLRLKVFALALGLGLTAFALISWTTIPAWPIVGVAVATVAVVINKMSVRLSHPTCHGCGADIEGLPGSQYGVACPTCGHLTQRLTFVAGKSKANPEA